MKRGQTLSAVRERLQTAGERQREQKRQKRRQGFRLALALALTAVVVATVAAGWYQLAERNNTTTEPAEATAPAAEIVDEGGTGLVSSRIKTYAAQLETDLLDLGYTVARFTLPFDSNYQLYVDLEGQSFFYKVNLERETAVSAEDIDRMARYLAEHEITPAEYVDVRVEGKATYK